LVDRLACLGDLVMPETLGWTAHHDDVTAMEHELSALGWVIDPAKLNLALKLQQPGVWDRFR